MTNFLIVIFSLVPWKAQANLLFLDTNFYYTSDNLTAATTTTGTKLLYDVSFGFSVSKGNQLFVGWNYTGQSFSSTDDSVTTTYVSTQMGPKLVYYFDKNRSYRLSFAYNLQTNATYTEGSSSAEKWKGTGMGADIGYQFHVNDSFAFGIRLNYSSATYKEKLVDETTYSTISYTKTFMYPSISMSCEF